MKPLRLLLVPLVIYASWIVMMLVHELGHVFHAWLSGGRVVAVHLPLIGFSQTIVHPNPFPLFVVWGGPIWGAMTPVIACAAILLLKRRVPQVLRFFAGFCLIANGAYLAVGWINRVGDAGDLVALGTPVWGMVVFGVACVAGGLWVWHQTRGVAGVGWR